MFSYIYVYIFITLTQVTSNQSFKLKFFKRELEKIVSSELEIKIEKDKIKFSSIIQVKH